MRAAHLPLVLLLGLTPVGMAPRAAFSEGFGRWETALRRCQLLWAREGNKPAQQSECQDMRLDQSIEGMLRVRFINTAPASRSASEEMVFVGLLHNQDRPMRCQQATCTPQWPMHLVLQSVTAQRFDGRGLAEHLPQVQLAQGRCLLEADQVQCEAQVDRGHRWRARAELRSFKTATNQGGPKR